MNKILKLFLLGFTIVNLSMVVFADETNVDEIVNVEESENIDEHPIEVYKKPGIEEDDGKEDNKPFSIS